ncbi:hypothetical protein CKO28_04905 [Rhodovibrio sodomensis]|uniref:Uncharacterized protein n=1 Tax=Rhodovibrio sodomensis TaxID=1088 RepID=A0ABS1DCQ4_9PROT|nr:hypothetical protein [Rhodovibrio sodomensis]
MHASLLALAVLDMPDPLIAEDLLAWIGGSPEDAPDGSPAGAARLRLASIQSGARQFVDYDRIARDHPETDCPALTSTLLTVLGSGRSGGLTPLPPALIAGKLLEARAHAAFPPRLRPALTFVVTCLLAPHDGPRT